MQNAKKEKKNYWILKERVSSSDISHKKKIAIFVASGHNIFTNVKLIIEQALLRNTES